MCPVVEGIVVTVADEVECPVVVEGIVVTVFFFHLEIFPFEDVFVTEN